MKYEKLNLCAVIFYHYENEEEVFFCVAFIIFAEQKAWVVSSVGLEHYLDRVGVTGSNPVQPTNFLFPL